MVSDRLLTYRDLQQILAVGKNRAYELLHSKGFPAVRIGGRYYVKESALNGWLDTYAGRSFSVS